MATNAKIVCTDVTLWNEPSKNDIARANTLNYCCILYDLKILVLLRRKNKCSKFQFCNFSLVHKSLGELFLALTMLKIKIAGLLPLLEYLSVTPLKPVEIAGSLPFIDSALHIEFAVMLMRGGREYCFSHSSCGCAGLIELKQQNVFH